MLKREEIWSLQSVGQSVRYMAMLGQALIPARHRGRSPSNPWLSALSTWLYCHQSTGGKTRTLDVGTDKVEGRSDKSGLVWQSFINSRFLARQGKGSAMNDGAMAASS